MDEKGQFLLLHASYLPIQVLKTSLLVALIQVYLSFQGPYSDPNENSIDDDIMNIVKNGGIDGLKVKEHNIDIDFTT